MTIIASPVHFAREIVAAPALRSYRFSHPSYFFANFVATYSLYKNRFKEPQELKQIKVKKGEILQRGGDLNSKVYKVISGLLRSYCIDHKGKEHIFMFAPENWTIADSQPKEKPCDLYIDALEDSIIIVLNKDIERERQYIGAFIKRLSVLQNRIIMLMSFSAIARYEHFEETYPEILQRVTQKMIASYLGMTPEALSTIKKNRIKKPFS